MCDLPKISRSISLPVKPQFSEPKTLKRSNEKEKVYSENENSMDYLYEDDELHDDDDDEDVGDDDDDDNHFNINNKNITIENNDKISLNIDAENILLKRNNIKVKPSDEIQLLNKSNSERRRRHSSDGNCYNKIVGSSGGGGGASAVGTGINDVSSDIGIAPYYIDSDTDTNFDDNDNDHDNDENEDVIIKQYDKNDIKNLNSNSEQSTSGIATKNNCSNINNENEIKMNVVAVPGTSKLNQPSVTLKQRYRKEKRRSSNLRKTSLSGGGGGGGGGGSSSINAIERRESQGWFGSTIEVNIQEEDTNDSCSYDDNEIVVDRFIRRSISRNINRRLIRKNGHQNVSFKNIPKRSLRYFKDLITTLIELEWSYVLSIFVIAFVGSWILFAVLWYLIAKAHGDLDFDPITGKHFGEIKKPCVRGAYDMTAMFIHSLELQTTIGFGEKYPTEECPEGVFLFVFQIILSIAFEGAIVAVVYAKMAKPVKLLSKFTFSKIACICLRDGKFCFIFRVCDPREQKCIGTKIRAYLVADAATPEGETMKVNTELKLEGDGAGIITWPETVCHTIDKNSPFYKFTAIDFHTKCFEVFISLVGHSPLTGQSTESRTSYLPHEILWGQRFPNIIDYNLFKQSYVVDYKNFHTTIAANIPYKSASHTDRLKF